MFEELQKNGWSVRQVEDVVKKLKSGETLQMGKKKIAGSPISKEFSVLRDSLSAFLNTKVSLSVSPSGKGKISIPFSNEEELEHIMHVFDQLK